MAKKLNKVERITGIAVGDLTRRRRNLKLIRHWQRRIWKAEQQCLTTAE